MFYVVPTVVREDIFNILLSIMSKPLPLNIIKGLINYSFYGIEPDNIESDISPSVMSYIMAKSSINSAQNRYDVAIEIGKKGGRPKKITEEIIKKIENFRKNGMTQK